MNLSGADTQGSRVFVVVYADSGQMKQLKAYAPAVTIKVELDSMALTDTVKVLWLDAQSMPLAQREVYKDGFVSNPDEFSSTLFSMIQSYEDIELKQRITDTIKQNIIYAKNNGSSLEQIIQSTTTFDYEFGRLIIHTRKALPDLNGYHVLQRLSDGEGNTILQFANAEDTRDCEDYLEEYINADDGDFIEPDRFLYVPPEDENPEQDASSATANSWGVSKIKADTYAKDLVKRGLNRKVVVAVVDSGVDYNHTFLKSRMVSGWDFVDGNNKPMDLNSHGTHVAGTIVDCTPDLTGVQIMPVRVLDASGCGYSSVVAEGIKYAANNGASVINLSLGGSHSDYKDNAINYAINKGCVVVVAAGNSGANVKNFCPGHMTNAISVAAVDKNLKPAYFSNYGDSVDLAAPGVNIKSSVPTSIYKSGYANFDGTSMAAPHVAACAAMLRYADTSLTPAQVETKLKNSVQVPSGWDTRYGKGVVNMELSTPSTDYYAIPYVYGSGVELVFQKNETPIPGKKVAESVSSAMFEQVIDEITYTKWHGYSSQILKVTFHDEIQPKSTATWFADCVKLTEFEGLEKLDTSKVTDMSRMFARCSSLTKLDLSTFKTDNVTSMKQMFNNCEKLQNIYVSDDFKVSGADGTDMFKGCTSLPGYSSSRTGKEYARIDNGGYFSRAVFYAIMCANNELVFQNSKTLSSGRTIKSGTEPYSISCIVPAIIQNAAWYDHHDDITKVTFLDTIKPLSTATWFSNCTKLTAFVGLDKLDTSNVTDMSRMFARCSAVTSLDLRTFNTAKVTTMKQMFNNCSALQTLDLRNWNTGNVTDMKDMFKGSGYLTKIQVDDTFTVAKVTDGTDMFKDCKSLVGGNGTKYNVYYVDKTYARKDSASAPGYFSPAKVDDQRYKVTISSNIQNGNVTGTPLTNVASGTKVKLTVTPNTNYKLSELKVTKASGGVITPAQNSATEYEFTMPTDNVNVSAVFEEVTVTVTNPIYAVLYTDGELAFQANLNAQSGKSIQKTYTTDSDGYDLNDRGVYMPWHDDRASIKSVNFTAVIAPTKTEQWFCDCANLTTIKNLGNLYTGYVTSMSEMFSDCEKLTELDLSNFNTAKVTSMYHMFYSCEKLTTIYASSSFTVSSVSDSLEMFDECTSLVGGKGTKYDSNHTDKAYARIDGGTSAPGYFKSK